MTRHLGDFVADWPAVRRRVRNEWIRKEVDRFDAAAKVEQVNAAQETRNQQQDQASIDHARQDNGRMLFEAQPLSAVLNDAL